MKRTAKGSGEKHSSEGIKMKYEIKEVALKDHPFLLGLTNPGMAYQDYSPDTIIKVAAEAGNYRELLNPDSFRQADYLCSVGHR